MVKSSTSIKVSVKSVMLVKRHKKIKVLNNNVTTVFVIPNKVAFILKNL